MKKYLWLGLAIVLLGVCGALIWRADADSCGKRKGLSGHSIQAKAMLNWNRSSQDALTSVEGNVLYLQEAIGSQGATLTSPQALKNNFIVTFDLMSITRRAELQFKTSEADGAENYVFEIFQQPGHTKVRLHRGKVVTQQKYIQELLPDVYYPVEIEKDGTKISIKIGGEPAAELNDSAPLPGGKLVIAIQGQPDHPAGVNIKNFRLYQ